MSASAAPTARSGPVAAPSASVFTDAVWVAVPVSAPSMTRSAEPDSTATRVVAVENDVAAPAEIAVPPAAPVFTFVVTVCVVVATSSTSSAPETLESSPMAAVVASKTMWKTTEAPTPVASSLPFTEASAFASLTVFAVASLLRSAPPAETLASSATIALDVLSTTLTARPPAKVRSLLSLSPAPDLAETL